MNLQSMIRPLLLLTGTSLLGACMVGPKYNKPPVATPAAYKETGDWKIAQPRDATPRFRARWASICSARARLRAPDPPLDPKS